MKDGSSNMFYQMPVGSGSDSFSVSLIDILSLRLKPTCYRLGWKTDIPCNLKKNTFSEIIFIPSWNSQLK